MLHHRSNLLFLKLLKYQNTIKSEEHLKAWLIRVTINQCKSKGKSIWNKRKVSLDSIAEIPDEEKYKDFSDVYQAVMDLNIKYRDVIHLYYYEEFSIKEIADILGRKEGTIKTQLARGRHIFLSILYPKYAFP